MSQPRQNALDGIQQPGKIGQSSEFDRRNHWTNTEAGAELGEIAKIIKTIHKMTQSSENPEALLLPDCEVVMSDKAIRQKNAITYNANEIRQKIGDNASLGVDMLGAKNVTIGSDDSKLVHIVMDRGEKAKPRHTSKYYETPGSELVFGKNFSFDITKNGDQLKLTNVKGLSIVIGAKEIPINKMEMSKKDGVTELTVHADKGFSKTISVPLENTFNGFAEFWKAGAAQSRTSNDNKPWSKLC